MGHQSTALALVLLILFFLFYGHRVFHAAWAAAWG